MNANQMSNEGKAIPTVVQLNRNLADTIVEETKQNPQSAYAGKSVGIANGNVIIVTDDRRRSAGTTMMYRQRFVAVPWL